MHIKILYVDRQVLQLLMNPKCVLTGSERMKAEPLSLSNTNWQLGET